MIKNIFFDFDGVILNSMAVRDFGFKSVFSNFDQKLVDKLIIYHRINGGLSRYVKIRYFFEQLLNTSISEEEVLEYAEKFSLIMKKMLINPKNLITESVDFIKENHKNYALHIVSGSDQNELQFLCKSLNLSQYFITINGSPTPKNQLVQEIIDKYDYKSTESCLIGDSINDFEAANNNDISFWGYNNLELNHYPYIDSFTSFNPNNK